MNELIVKDVNFQGTTLLAIQDKDTKKIYAGINLILRDLGFDERQIEYRRNKWNTDKVISKGVQKFSYPLEKGGIQEAYCIDIMKLPLALAKIEITPKMEKEMPDLSFRLEMYQERCADVLANEFIVKEEKKTENQVQFKEIIEVIPLIAQDLNVNNISRLIMYKDLCKYYNVPTSFLPSYIDNGDREKKSATELLKQFQCGISARQFNILMIKAGYLEERVRKSTSSKTGVKKFKVLTEKGKEYGENQTAEQNAKETQPLYFVDTFQELFDLVMQEVA